jgi:hypothetical protein
MVLLYVSVFTLFTFTTSVSVHLPVASSLWMISSVRRDPIQPSVDVMPWVLPQSFHLVPCTQSFPLPSYVWGGQDIPSHPLPGSAYW